MSTQLLSYIKINYNALYSAFISKDACDTGYYIRNSIILPEDETLVCSEDGTWNVQQKECQQIFLVVNTIKTLLFQVSAKRVQYAVPKLAKVKIIPKSLHQFACELIGGHLLMINFEMRKTFNMSYQLTDPDHPPFPNGSIVNA